MLVKLNIDEMAKLVEEKMGDGVHVKTVEIRRNNALCPALVVEGSGSASLVFYPEKGMGITEMAEMIKKGLRDYQLTDPEWGSKKLRDWNEQKKHAWLKLTTDREYAAMYPHKIWAGDIYILLQLKMHGASITVTSKGLEELGVGFDEFFVEAKKNVTDNTVFTTMDETLNKMSTGKFPDNILYKNERAIRHHMYVLTSKDSLYGASAIVCPEILNWLNEFFPHGTIVIPSSIHELIFIETEGPFDAFGKMVRDINKSEVKKEDQLSNHIYQLTNGRLF